MPSKSRGGLSKREYAKLTGQPAPKQASVKSSKSNKSSTSKLAKIASEYNEGSKAYESTLMPTTEENQAEQTLNNLVQSENLGINKIRQQAIPLTFIQGQSARLQEQTASQAIPLKLQLATLASRRQAAADVAKAKLSNTKEKYNLAYKAASAKPKTNPLDDEYKQLRNEKVKISIAKASAKVSHKTSPNEWSPWTVKNEKRYGRTVTYSQRINKKTGEIQKKQ